MRKLLAAAMLGLAVAGSAFAPISGAALAQGDVVIDQPIVDEVWLTNQSYTLDDTQSNGSNETVEANDPGPSADPPGCSCAVIQPTKDAV